MKSKVFAARAQGVELERRAREHWQGQIMIYPDVESVGTNRYDVITGFHVIEHLTDPRTMLKTLGTKLAKNGRMVIEVPSSEDECLTLYGSEAFQKFTYWSQHLYLFGAEALRRLSASPPKAPPSIGPTELVKTTAFFACQNSAACARIRPQWRRIY